MARRHRSGERLGDLLVGIRLVIYAPDALGGVFVPERLESGMVGRDDGEVFGEIRRAPQHSAPRPVGVSTLKQHDVDRGGQAEHFEDGVDASLQLGGFGARLTHQG